MNKEEVKRVCLQAVMDEEELTGSAPTGLFEYACISEENWVDLMRIAVRTTKNNIIDRINERLEDSKWHKDRFIR